MAICSKRHSSCGTVVALAAALWCGQGALAEDDYTLGQGLRFDDIKISGYLTVEGEIPEDGKSELLVDDLSLFVQGRFNRFFNPFFEAEIASMPVLKEGEAPFSGGDAKIILERLYNDTYLRDNLVLRLGKSLTPIGEWNGIHAGPLVPTTSRPLTTYRGFSEFISGASIIYTPRNENLPVATLYWQPDGGLSHDFDAIENRVFHNIKGMNLSWTWDLENTVGLSLQHADVTGSSEKQILVGFNAHLVTGNMEWRTELTKSWLDNPRAMRVRDDEFGAFVQGTYNIGERWSLHGRYEYFQDRDYIQASENAILGFSYRPKPPVVWKLEYAFQWGQELNIEQGLLASLAILF
ncbi:MAG: hypothetical protein HWE08_06400 [Alphaproteobacteria bacterium]|nr:hypothetical protein [Alphaproteobacteria bacterium]